MTCAADIEKYRNRIAEDRVYIFLAGLDNKLDQVRSRVLGTSPLPRLEEVYSMVRRELQRQVAMGAESHFEASALTVQKSTPIAINGNSTASQSRFCTYCNKNTHTIDVCWKKHGYPEWYKLKQVERKNKKFAHNTVAQNVAAIDTTPSSASHVSRASSQEGIFGLSVISAHPSTWIIDSGATDHMTSNSSIIDSLTSPPVKSVQVANGNFTPIIGAGNVSLSPKFSMSSVLLAPKLSNNLLSISKITKHLNCSVIFHSTHCVFQDNLTKMTIGIGKERDGLYYWEDNRGITISTRGFQTKSGTSDIERIILWHRRLGHPSFSYLEHMFPKLFSNISTSSLRCEQCVYAKNHRVPFKVSFNKSVTPFSCVYTDVWGPFSTTSTSGHQYFVSFIDDCTRVSWVYLMKSKSDVCHIIPQFYNMILTQFNTRIKVFHSDNGREFVNRSLADFMIQHGILHQTTCVYTPQQNGTAERKNRHFLEVARALCFTMHVPKHFWAEAIMAAVFLINRMPAKVIDFQTPLRMLSKFHSIPSALNICPKVFGCVCYVHVHSHHRDKLDPRAIKCVFLGYSNSQKGYKCFHPPTRTYYVSMDVQFCENESYFSGHMSAVPLQGEIKSREEEKQWLEEKRIWISGIENAKENGESLVLDDGQENKIETNSERPAHLFEKGYSRRTKDITVMPSDSCTSLNDNTSLDDTTMLSNESSKIDTKVCTSSESLDSYPNIDQNRRYPLRERKEPDRLGFSKASNVSYPISDFISYHRLSKANLTFALQLSSVYVPSHFQEALDDPKWKDAMVEEMMALQKNSTWEMVELPMGKKTVGCKWVFNVKYKSDGTVERYKARLVAKGYTQTYGIDYQETFAPVAKMNTVRVILSLAVNLDWPLRQFDVKNAFLHGELTEEVFMDPPQGFTLEEGKVCRLKKALYGLKQSPRAWFGRLSHAMEEYGFKQASADHTLFYKRNYNDITVLLVYVDDMIVTGNNKEEIENLRSYLAKEFEIKDLGTLKYFLGIEVSRSKQGLFLSQRKYTLELLAETGMSACEPIDTPIEVNHGLAFFSDQIPTNKERYQRIVGRLIYLTHTRPDLAYAVSVVSQFMHNPSDQHMNAVNRILAYLKSAPGKGVLFSKHEHFDVVGYTDSDFAGSKLDRKSTSGYLAFVGGNLVSWKSKKQNVVSLSSAEAEYRAMHHAITELSWLKILLKEIGFGPKGSMVLFCDNMAAIKIANNPVQHDRTKHVEIDRNYIKDNLDSGTIEIPYTRSSDQLADIMTHAVTSSLFNASLSKLGICDIYAPT